MITTASVEALTTHRSLQYPVGHCVRTCQAFGKRCVYSAVRRVSNGSKLRSSKASVSVPELHSHSIASGSPSPAT
jgi:hypothetical protein